MVKNPLLISGIFLIISLVFGLTLVWPKYQDFIDLRKKIEGKKIELKTQANYFEDLQKISKELKKYQSQISKIDSALPEKISLPEVLNFLQKISSQSGLLLKNISPKTIALEVTKPGEEEITEETKIIKGPEIKETKINLSLTGDYPSFKNFLSLLEKSARLFEIESISLSSDKEGLNFDLKIKVYSY